MKYLWEVVLEARKEEIPIKEIRFIHSTEGSAYMELVFPYLNQTEISVKEIEVNTYHRFYSIFCNMYRPEQTTFPDLCEGLTNLILHMLAENDVLGGMTKEEYYKRLLDADFEDGVCGKFTRTVVATLEKEKKELLLSGWLRMYQTGSSLAVFIDMVHGLIEDSIVYHNNDSPDMILIYTRLRETPETAGKIECLVNLFLDIRYQAEIFYEYHFGIIGVEDTMLIDEIAMY